MFSKPTVIELVDDFYLECVIVVVNRQVKALSEVELLLIKNLLRLHDKGIASDTHKDIVVVWEVLN